MTTTDCSGILSKSAVKVDPGGLCSAVTFNNRDFSTEQMAREIDLVIALVEAQKKTTGGVPKLLAFPYVEPLEPGTEVGYWCRRYRAGRVKTLGYLSYQAATQIFRPKGTAGPSARTAVCDWRIPCCKLATSRAHIRCLLEYVMIHDNTFQNVAAASPFLGTSSRLARVKRLLGALLDQADPAVLEHEFFYILRRCVDAIEQKKAICSEQLTGAMRTFLSDAQRSTDDDEHFKRMIQEAHTMMLSSPSAARYRYAVLVKKIGASVALIPPVQACLTSAVHEYKHFTSIYHAIDARSTALGASGAGVGTAGRVRAYCHTGTNLETALQRLNRIVARNASLCRWLTTKEQGLMMFTPAVAVYLLQNTVSSGRELFLTTDAVEAFKQAIAVVAAKESGIIESWETSVREYYDANRTELLKAYWSEWLKIDYPKQLTISTALAGPLTPSSSNYYTPPLPILNSCIQTTQLQRFLECMRFVDPAAGYALADNTRNLSTMLSWAEMVQGRSVSATDGKGLVKDCLAAILCNPRPDSPYTCGIDMQPVLDWIKLAKSSPERVHNALTELCARAKYLCDVLMTQCQQQLQDGRIPRASAATTVETAFAYLQTGSSARVFLLHSAGQAGVYRKAGATSAASQALNCAQDEAKALAELCSEASRDWWEVSLDASRRDLARRKYLAHCYIDNHVLSFFTYQYRRLFTAADFNTMIKSIAATDQSLIDAQFEGLHRPQKKAKSSP